MQLDLSGADGQDGANAVTDDEIEQLSGRHLAYLLAQNFPNNADMARLAVQVQGGTSPRKDAIAFLKARDPGIGRRLADTWRSVGTAAVHSFTIPVLQGNNFDDCRREIDALHQVKLGLGRVHEMALPRRAVGTHLRRFRLVEGTVLDVILIYGRTARRRSAWGNETFIDDQELALTVDLGNPDHLAHVYAAEQLSKVAVQGFLKHFFRLNATPESIRPVEIDQRRVLDVKTRLGLKHAYVAGDKRGATMTSSYRGGKDPHGNRLPLDEAHPEVKEQLKGNNPDHELPFEYVHTDGYHEQSRVAFSFTKATTSGMVFKLKTSRPAMRWLVTEFLKP